jgi:hypothetical protein
MLGSATKPKPSKEDVHISGRERLVPLSTSTNGDADDSSYRSLRFMARAFFALSVALLISLIAVSIVLSNSRTSGMPTPVAPAVAPKFAITREAFGQYTRVLIKNEGAFAFCFAFDVLVLRWLSDICIFFEMCSDR